VSHGGPRSEQRKERGGDLALKRLSTTSDAAMRRLSARPPGGGGVGPSAALRLLDNLFKVRSRRSTFALRATADKRALSEERKRLLPAEAPEERRRVHLARRRHHRGHDAYWDRSLVHAPRDS